MKIFKNFSKKGFTLIELIIVIAIIAILAVGLIAALDPVEQTNKANDTAKKNTAFDVSKALDRYYATKGSYPTTPSTAITELINVGELKAGTTGVNVYCGTDANPCGGTTKPWSCFTKTSKNLKLDWTAATNVGTGYDQVGTDIAQPKATAGCTANIGTSSSTCTIWCVR